MTLFALSGSLRAESSTVALLRAALALAPDETQVDVFNQLADVPPFSPDRDVEPFPPAVADLRARIHRADAVLIVTPEYAHGMPGVLKNALDWCVSDGTFYRKPVAAMSASPSQEGGAKALRWLCETLGAHGAVVSEAATFSVPFVRKQLNGDRLVDAATITRVEVLFRALE